MARYKHIDQSPRFLPVDLAQQPLPGTFEHAAHHLLAHAVDLSRFDARFRNNDTHTDRIQRRLDTPEGRAQYGRRFATVEPVLGNLRANKQLDRFTLRGRTKVDGQ